MILPSGTGPKYRPVGDEPIPERVWCGRCGYSLAGLGEPEVCPECGASPVPMVTDAPDLGLCVEGEEGGAKLAHLPETKDEDHRRRLQVAMCAWLIGLVVQAMIFKQAPDVTRGFLLGSCVLGLVGSVVMRWRTNPLSRVTPRRRDLVAGVGIVLAGAGLFVVVISCVSIPAP
ncbi:MAG: hypothetical protein R3B49_07370 [Phycisphaerales bacterium]